MLVLARKHNEALLLECRGVRVRIVVRLVRGKVRLAMEAPTEVTIWREEKGPWDHRKKGEKEQ